MIDALYVTELRTSSIVFLRALGSSGCGIIFPPLYLMFSTLLLLFLSLLFFTLSNFQSSPSFSLLCYLIATILYRIWISRNLATFRNSTLCSPDLINLIKNDVKSRIICATDDSVRNFWSLRSAFCSIDDDGSIAFHL